MLRTLGASSRQVLTAVLIEAALVGLLASLLGIAGGFGFVLLIKGLFEAMGFELPTSGLSLDGATIAIVDRGRRADDRRRGAQPGAPGDPGRAARGAGRERRRHRGASARARGARRSSPRS